MELFARCDREPERLLAVTGEGKRYTLGDLNAAAERIAGAVGGHRLVFVLCENTPGTLLGYLGCLKAGEVPLLLDAHIAPELLRGLLETYRPAFVHVPGDLPAETGRVLEGFVPALEVEDSVLLRRPGGQGPELHPELALLLTTSGSTGSPKLVRLSGRNLDANTRSIVEYLELDEADPNSANDFGKNVIPAMLNAGERLFAYPFDGYWKDVGTIQSLWEANMDLIDNPPKFNINDRKWIIYSRNFALSPHYVGKKAKITNSTVTEGCNIDGEINHSVIFGGVEVGEGAKITDSVVMPGAVIGKNVVIEKAVIGNDAIIKDGSKIGVSEAQGENKYASKYCTHGIVLIEGGAEVDGDIPKNSMVEA